MTDYFEVHERDGAARLGELRLDAPLTTPALVAPADDDTPGVPDGARVLRDAGSAWPEEREIPEGDDARLTIHPHRATPAGTNERVAEAFFIAPPDVAYPSAAVVSPATAADHGTDAYVLSGASGIVGHAEAFVESVIDTREAVAPDAALYLAGVATPTNVALLAYAGVDLVDADRAWIRGLEGFYLATDGERFLADLRELPCACPACARGLEQFERADCAEHNVRALAAELRRVRERIRAERLRDYLEGQARHEPWLTAALRRFDEQYAYLEHRTPVVRNAPLLATTEDALRRVEIQRFAERVTSRYRCRFDAPLVLVPCSARKPYSDSQSHAQFNRAIRYRGHVVSMTSPIGVVPQELEHTYPAQHYDSAVTGRWSAEEVDFPARVLEAYLERNPYPRVIAHVPPEGYRAVVERVERSLDLDVEYTVTDHPTTDDSLSALAAALEGEPRYSKREREHSTVRAIADYQFGPDAGDALFEAFGVESRIPKLRVLEGGEQLAAMVPEYGTLALTLAGARRWTERDLPTEEVHIDGFVPHGSVLAPGIENASASIRIGDEVVIDGPRAFGVGRAAMSGPEMTRSTRGVAVEVRHVEETG